MWKRRDLKNGRETGGIRREETVEERGNGRKGKGVKGMHVIDLER